MLLERNLLKGMTRLLIALSPLFIVVACNQTANSAKNMALIEKYVHAVESLDYETMASCLDDNYIGIGPSVGDSIRKTEAVANWKSNAENLYAGIKYEKSKFIAISVPSGESHGDWVSTWAELKITYQDGDAITILANTIYKIANDKIIESITFYNEADALEQLGYVFINPDDL